MGHTFFADYEHIVFSTKHRMGLIDEPLQAELWPYLAASIRNQGCTCLIVGGRPEHVHILTRMSPTLLVGDLVKEIKRTSSMWAKGKGLAYGEFYWQDGYGSFSVTCSNLDAVRNYIANQHAHHRKMSWEKESRGLLEKHGIDFDERSFLD